MKVYYWEGSIWKNRELDGHAVLTRVTQSACVMPPNFIMGSPIIDFQGADGKTDVLSQFGIIRVIDPTTFDMDAFMTILAAVFPDRWTISTTRSHHTRRAKNPTIASPDWERMFDDSYNRPEQH